MKTSTALSRDQVERLRMAWFHAKHYRLALNAFVTVNWSLAARSEWGGRQSTRWFLKRLGEYAGRHGFPRAWIWVRENPMQRDHIHVAVYVPETIGLAAFRRWVRRLVGGKSRAVVVKPVADRVCLDYFIKGAPEDMDVNRFGQGSQGVIVGLRAGVSESLNLTAIKRRLALEGVSRAA